jgi:hypothetical protein
MGSHEDGGLLAIVPFEEVGPKRDERDKVG